MAEIPVAYSTCVAVNSLVLMFFNPQNTWEGLGMMLAVNGEVVAVGELNAQLYTYNSVATSWNVFSLMPTDFSVCLIGSIFLANEMFCCWWICTSWCTCRSM